MSTDPLSFYHDVNTHQEHWVIVITQSNTWHWIKDYFILDQGYECSAPSQFLPTSDIRVATWYPSAEVATQALRTFNKMNGHTGVQTCVVKLQYTLTF